jgi:hypothetical protein
MADKARSGAKIRPLDSIEISESDLQRLTPSTLVARLVAGGVSPLTAERFVEIRRGGDELGRARPHATSRR